MNEPRNYHMKWNKSDREKQINVDTIYMWNLKEKVQMNLSTKQK